MSRAGGCSCGTEAGREVLPAAVTDPGVPQSDGGLRDFFATQLRTTQKLTRSIACTI